LPVERQKTSLKRRIYRKIVVKNWNLDRLR